MAEILERPLPTTDLLQPITDAFADVFDVSVSSLQFTVDSD
jgi:hypothetical protein